MALPKLETPTYKLNLPSTNEEVIFRPFLVKEHKVLLSMSESSEDEIARIVTEIVNVCTFNKLNVKDLPHFDIEYIFLQLRSKSIGEGVDIVITCGGCNEKYDHSFNIDDVKVIKKENASNKIMITDTIGIELSYPKFNDVVSLLEDSSTQNIISIVKKCVVGIFNEESYFEAEDQSEEELDEFLMSMTSKQFEKIEEFFVNSPKIVQEFETNCPNCNSRNYSKIEGIQNFFV